MKKLITLIVALGVLSSLQAKKFDCDKASTEIYSLYNAGKYKEIKEKRLDGNFAWSCSDDYDTMIFIGNMYFHKLENYVAAGSYFEKAMDKHPEKALAYLDLAAVKIKFEEYDEAVELCEKVLVQNKLGKEDEFAFNAQAGMALFKKGSQIDEVKERDEILRQSEVYLDKALAHNPKYPTGNYYVATIYYFIDHDKQKATKHYKIACDNGMQAACKPPQ